MAQRNNVKYEVLDHRTHVLQRPDMYIGSVKPEKAMEYVANITGDDATKGHSLEYTISKEEISYIPGLLRLFVEILSNAVDNKIRSDSASVRCTTIKVNIDPLGKTSIYNNGLSIPIEINSQTGTYNPEVIFGTLLSSSNYDDTKTREWIGKNGVGSKITNIFSIFFSVNILDPVNRKTYYQEWSKNMSIKGQPVIKSTALKTGFTEVTWIPDFTKFGLQHYPPNMLKLYYKYVLDAAMVTSLTIYLNEEKIVLKSLSDYSRLYNSTTKEIVKIDGEQVKQLVIMGVESKGDVISFVNGVYTPDGGVHSEAAIDSVLKPLLSKFNKAKNSTITVKDIKPYFMIFLTCVLPNPEFSSQSKTKLTSPKPHITVPETVITKISKWSFVDRIKEILAQKNSQLLKKVEKKGKKFQKIPGFDYANNSGGVKSLQCTLILCEGDSAKTFAVKGIQVGWNEKKGRDWYGIYPLRGKVLNARNSAITTLTKNKEVTDIIQILGLRQGVDYSQEDNYKTLNYGKVMIISDSDCDGIHITGLIMNLFHYLFPTLLSRNEFLISMLTPIVKIRELEFYDLNQARTYIQRNQCKEKDIRYYKGLGTSTDQDIKTTFGKQVLQFVKDEHTDSMMVKVFCKKQADQRKKWLEEYSPNNPSVTNKIKNERVVKVPISEYLDIELIKFSVDDCKRSIPNLVDGLKESHRKVLYACFLKNLNYTSKSMKVAQLAGYVAEKTNYVHGEQCLYDTITKMAQRFVGSNNIPLLFNDGQFGSRLNGGEDAASARYIFTKLDKLTRLIYPQEDDELLEKVWEDGEEIEPHYFIPIIPMILVNGSLGIGTGFSSSVPCFNPKDLIKLIRSWLRINIEGGKKIYKVENGSIISGFPDISPWYQGFEGEIRKIEENKYESIGKFNSSALKTSITELPIGMWTDNYKEYLEDLLENKQIKSLKNHSTADKVHFDITHCEDGIKPNNTSLRLVSKISMNNMVLFSSENKIKKYVHIDSIMDEFCGVRYNYYIKRKQNLLDKLAKELKEVSNKYRFLKDIMDKKLVIYNVPQSEVLTYLEKYYDKINSSFDYLLKQNVRSFTKEKLEKLKNQINNIEIKIKQIKATNEMTMWLNDLEILEKEL